MSYDDFWFIDTRVQTVNLRRWLIWFILLFALVTVGSYFAIKTMYYNIEINLLQSENYTISVTEAKATNVNGYINGTIENKSQEEITGRYLNFLLYNKENEFVGSEFIEIENLQPAETKTFEVKFKYNNVEKFYAMMSDDIITEDVIDEDALVEITNENQEQIVQQIPQEATNSVNNEINSEVVNDVNNENSNNINIVENNEIMNEESVLNEIPENGISIQELLNNN